MPISALPPLLPDLTGESDKADFRASFEFTALDSTKQKNSKARYSLEMPARIELWLSCKEQLDLPFHISYRSFVCLCVIDSNFPDAVG